jgi:acyl transferase domain-containing protein
MRDPGDPAHRFNQARYFDPVPGAYAKSYSRLGECIPDGGFDAEGLRQPSTLAESTDPAHLWALEVAKSALENAGLDPWE